jgi:hypothetical protein
MCYATRMNRAEEARAHQRRMTALALLGGLAVVLGAVLAALTI